uniref:SAP30-binding protein-like n=1 Tax=Phallusia mammillata TaxID=59560 RepID=A0A6F9DRW6_9ASCI|nr:SAP30-binding protein-like [Phallusia mammillata]
MAALSALSAYVESDEEHEDEHEGDVGVLITKPTPPVNTEVKNGMRNASPAFSDNMDDMEGSFNMDEKEEHKEEDGTESVEKDNEKPMVVSDEGEPVESVTERVNGIGEKPAKRKYKRYSCENATAFAAKLRTLPEEELQLPAEPEVQCMQNLQDKIKGLYEKKIRDGENLNQTIQSRKDFRNPSIYDKLIIFLGIEERGTNFPKEEFDPDFWRKCPSYEDLARTQREELAKKEKDKKTKVEFVTGTVKKTASGSGSGERAKRTKWDDKSSNISTSKPTIISAVGTIKKNRA